MELWSRFTAVDHKVRVWACLGSFCVSPGLRPQSDEKTPKREDRMEFVMGEGKKRHFGRSGAGERGSGARGVQGKGGPGEGWKMSQDGLSSCRCSTTSYEDLKKISKNANQALNSFRYLQKNFHQEDGHSSDLDQKRSGILLTMKDHKENGTELQS